MPYPDGATSRHIVLGLAPKAAMISVSNVLTYLSSSVYGGVFVRLGSEVTS